MEVSEQPPVKGTRVYGQPADEIMGSRDTRSIGSGMHPKDPHESQIRGYALDEFSNTSEITTDEEEEKLKKKKEDDLTKEDRYDEAFTARKLFIKHLQRVTFVGLFVMFLFINILPIASLLKGLLSGASTGFTIACFVESKLYLQFSSKWKKRKDLKHFENEDAGPEDDPFEVEKSVWFNLWPEKQGHWDPLTYDVRSTTSVLVTIAGPYCQVQYPRTKIPYRKIYNVPEPDNVEFYDSKEIMDLTTCQMYLLPENLNEWSQKKRVWSRKYPIVLKTNSKKDSDFDIDTGNEFVGNAGRDRIEVEEVEALQIIEKGPQQSGYNVEETDAKTYFLFARTAREKEEWWKRFLTASRFAQDWAHDHPEEGQRLDPSYVTDTKMIQNFNKFMKEYLQAKDKEEAELEYEYLKSVTEQLQCAREQISFINTIGARIWFDVHQMPKFVDWAKKMCNKKVIKVKFSQYFKAVRIQTFTVSTKLPQLLSCSLPWQDAKGLWMDMDIEYNGVIEIEVATDGLRMPGKEGEAPEEEVSSNVTQEKDVGDTDSDSDEEDKHIAVDSVGNRGLIKYMRSDFVVKFAESEWAQKYILGKRLTLKIKVERIKGLVTLNFQPPLSNRIWYGFRHPPELGFSIVPIFEGKYVIKTEGPFATLLKMMESKMRQEFLKVMVWPNLDNMPIPKLPRAPIRNF